MFNHTRLWIATAVCIEVAACGSQRSSGRAPSPALTDNQVGDDEDTKAADERDESAEPTDSRGGVTADSESRASTGKAIPEEGARDTGSEAQPPVTKARPEQPSRDPGIVEICDKLTRRANQKCAKHVASLYQSSCNHYLQKPGNCAEPIRLALECQFKAGDDALCAHEADQNCLQLRRALKECQLGTALPEHSTAEDLTLPSGWKEVHDESLGFVVAMPPGATLDTTGKSRSWKAEEAAVEYQVTALEPILGKPSSQVWIRSIIGHVGTRCQRGLRLHGELEIKGTTVVQYHTACPDKTEWHGMLHVFKGKTVATSYHAPAGVTGVREPFFYSFRVAD